jgi:rhomboid protease GluP
MRRYQLPYLRNSVTLYILIATISVFILQTLSEIFLGYDYLLFFGAKINQFIFMGQVWRFFTPVLLHGSLLHLIFNMYALYSIGPGLENRFGTLQFFALYIIGGLWGNVLSFLLTPNASLGASSAIFGLIAAQAVYIYKNRALLGSAAKSMLMNIGMIVLVNLALGLSPGVDNWGHIGGLLGGLFFAWFASPAYGIIDGLFKSKFTINRENQLILVTIAAVLIASFAVALKIILV